MEKIRKYAYLIILLSLVLVGCGRKDEKDAERLDQLNDKVESLFNEETDDLAANNSEREFEEIALDIETEKEHELNEENEATFLEIDELYHDAVMLYELEEDIKKLFTGDIIREEVEWKELQALSMRLSDIDTTKWIFYVQRQEELLAEAKDQLKNIELATELVAHLYLDDRSVNPEVRREEEKNAREAVQEVKNKSIRKDLEKRLEKVDEKLTELEERELKKATEGIGFFEGMFLSSDNFIFYLDESLLLVAQNDASDNIVYYEVTEILSNTGKELTLALYQEPVEAMGVEGGEDEQTFYLSDNYDRITTEDGDEYNRLNQEEIDEVYERLPGLKNTEDWQN